MAGPRQHYLPRFLLRGFASRIENDDHYVWVLRPGLKIFESKVDNVGVCREFYGVGTLDESISAVEADHATLLNSLRRSTAATVLDPRIAELLVQLMIRTKHLRDSMTEAAEDLLNGIFDLLSDPCLLRGIAKDYLVEHGFTRSASDDILSHLESVPEYFRLMSRLRKQAREALVEGVQRGHVQALAKAMNPEPSVGQFHGLTWTLITPTNDPLILGDFGPIIQTEPDGRYKLLPEKDDIIRAVYLPIADRQLVVGTSSHPGVDVEELNLNIATHSRDFVVASSQERVERYSDSIGTESALLTKNQMEKILRDLLSDVTLSKGA